MLLADLTSVKREPLAKMLEIHTGAVLGLHPMFELQTLQVWQTSGCAL